MAKIATLPKGPRKVLSRGLHLLPPPDDGARGLAPVLPRVEHHPLSEVEHGGRDETLQTLLVPRRDHGDALEKIKKKLELKGKTPN